jgi:hypothetical protein
MAKPEAAASAPALASRIASSAMEVPTVKRRSLLRSHRQDEPDRFFHLPEFSLTAAIVRQFAEQFPLSTAVVGGYDGPRSRPAAAQILRRARHGRYAHRMM